MRFKSIICIFIFLLLLPAIVLAAEYTEGSIKLVLHEENGRFTLYSMNDQRRPAALFADQDPRTSFLSVIINDRSYKMGDTSAFRTRTGGDEQNPSLVFASSFMRVTEEFSFIKSANQAVPNGIRITITLENRGDRQISSGARFLLDTYLGEGSPPIQFTTDRRTISSETLITGADRDRFWTDKNETVALTGSINTGTTEDPDSVHFANWKKLNDASWKAVYQEGRNFNFPPFSMGDTAICYYFEPRPLSRGEKRSFGFNLFLNDPAMGEDAFVSSPKASPAVVAELIKDLPDPSATDSREQDLAAIRELISRIETSIASGTATEEELAAFELALNKFRAKYGSGSNLR